MANFVYDSQASSLLRGQGWVPLGHFTKGLLIDTTYYAPDKTQHRTIKDIPPAAIRSVPEGQDFHGFKSRGVALTGKEPVGLEAHANNLTFHNVYGPVGGLLFYYDAWDDFLLDKETDPYGPSFLVAWYDEMPGLPFMADGRDIHLAWPGPLWTV